MKLKKFKEIDHKKRSVIIFTIICILLISGVFLYRTFAIFETNDTFNLIEGNVGSIGDITFSIYIDNELVKDVPEKGTKVFDSYHSYCENGSIISWNEHSWEASIKNLNNTKTKCHLKFISGYEESTLNGAIPDLGNGKLTPITIENNGIVKKADITKPWYSYQDKEWANAVILKENSYELLNENGKIYGEPTMEEDSLYLDGVNDYVDLGLENYSFGDQITLAINLKFNKYNDGNVIQELLGNWERAGGGIALSKNNYIYGGGFHINGKYQNDIISDEKVTLNQYYTIILIYNGTKAQLYINGKKQLQENEISGNITPSSVAFAIGANLGPTGVSPGNYSNVNVKQAAIFNRAINEEEIANISNENFKITNSEGLLKYVDFTNKEYQETEVIPEDNIESYFVWIPRFKYQIFSDDFSKYLDFQKLGVKQNNNDIEDKEKTTQINIEFETNDVAASDGNIKNTWLTHPAFTSFNNSNGFWIGKFETGYEGATTAAEASKNERADNKIIVKPNVYSWRGIDISHAFYTSYDYKRELESHLTKNMEWGAVAYLTQSKYGKCTNNNCENIRMNNSENCITGMSAKQEPTCGYTLTNVSCNSYESPSLGKDGTNIVNYSNPQSVASSNTGNYYGIFDMSGGAWDVVMGVMQYSPDYAIPSSGRDASENSGFNGSYSFTAGEKTDGLPFPEKKYYDLYDYGTVNTQFRIGHIGDATIELGPFYQIQYLNSSTPIKTISGWNYDHALTVNAGGPYYFRGGDYAMGTASGIFAFDYIRGKPQENNSFRIILTP